MTKTYRAIHPEALDLFRNLVKAVNKGAIPIMAAAWAGEFNTSTQDSTDPDREGYKSASRYLRINYSDGSALTVQVEVSNYRYDETPDEEIINLADES